MARHADLLVTGIGAFASRLILDLALVAERPVRVAVGGRENEGNGHAEWLCRAANARAAMMGKPAQFEPVVLDWESQQALADVVGALRPACVVHSASIQSPWDILENPQSPWSRFIERAGGFGFTAPLQALLARRISLAAGAIDGRLVNVCYPDFVNPVLAAAGCAPVCGAGNVAILAAYMADALGRREPGAVRLLAHHFHLAAFFKPAADRRGRPPRVWMDGRELADVDARFASIFLPRRQTMAALAGTSAAPLALALLGHHDLLGHAPGPLGRSGGYPIAVRNGILSLDLPRGLTVDDAAAWLKPFSEHDVAQMTADGRIVWAESTREALRRECPDLADGFAIADLEAACSALLALRERLCR